METLSIDDLLRLRDAQPRSPMYDILVGKRISDMSFPQMGDMSLFVMHGAFFENVIFNEIAFNGSDLSQAKFKNCVFERCILSKSDFIQSEFENVVFSRSKMARSKFVQAIISKSIFDQCDLINAAILDSRISETVFNGAKVTIHLKDNVETNVLWI